MSQKTRINYEISRIEKIVTEARAALELYEPVLKTYKDQAVVIEAKETAAKEAAAKEANDKKAKEAKATK